MRIIIFILLYVVNNVTIIIYIFVMDYLFKTDTHMLQTHTITHKHVYIKYMART